LIERGCKNHHPGIHHEPTEIGIFFLVLMVFLVVAFSYAIDLADAGVLVLLGVSLII
jgi:hypothetical protein